MAPPPQALAALKQHRAQQREHMMKYRNVWSDNNLIFPSVDGTAVASEALFSGFPSRNNATGRERQFSRAPTTRMLQYYCVPAHH